MTFKDTQYLSSGELNEQLGRRGAYADVLIRLMTMPWRSGYVTRSHVQEHLVMVAGEDSELPPSTPDQRRRPATGDYTVAGAAPLVPAGNYTNQALSTVGCFIDADGKTGKDSAGTDGSYDGTPLEGKVNLQSSVGNVCKQAQSEP